MKKWVILNKQRTGNKQQRTKEIIKILLKNRGLTKKKEIEDFLCPSLDQLTIDNLGISKSELNKAVKRIKEAIKDKETIIVYTDYDADGICGGAIIWETLYNFGAKAMPYVPHREKEGYGLSKQGIDFIKKEYQTKLIITVDHGISAIDKITYAKKLGIETIVLDHHVLPKKLPKASALVHTTKLAAGGIAWFFANYLLTKANLASNSSTINHQPSIINLDLAALATIADLVLLIGPNRIIVKYGLEQLNKTKRVGVKALIVEAGLRKGEIGVYEVGHILAPRINAMGRLTSALDALRLICTKDEERAEKLAGILSRTNRERQILMKETTGHAISNVETSEKLDKLIFISHQSYKEGIIGLVAGKLAEQFGRPAIVVSEGKEYSKASARSISGFDIVSAIRQVSHLLEDVGGHPMAAGFTVATKNIKEVKRRLLEIAKKSIESEKLEKVIKIDLEIDFPDITPQLYTEIQKLAPFGVGNPAPVFVSRNVEVIGASQVGREKQHLKLVVRQNKKVEIGNNMFAAIGFGMGEFYGRLSLGILIDVVYTIDEDKWNGNSRLQLKLKDVNLTCKS